MAAQAALISPAEYLSAEVESLIRHEFVAGSVYAMSGASRNHGTLTSNLSGILYRELADGESQNLDQDTKVWVREAAAYYYPDATVSCPPNYIDEPNGVIDNPRVIVEVLSPSTTRVDRVQKFAHYRSLASLRDYILIESELARVEVFSLEDDRWVVRSFEGLDSIAEIPSIGVRLVLAELYRRVIFSDA